KNRRSCRRLHRRRRTLSPRRCCRQWAPAPVRLPSLLRVLPLRWRVLLPVPRTARPETDITRWSTITHPQVQPETKRRHLPPRPPPMRTTSTMALTTIPATLSSRSFTRRCK
ncbi:unnamed protein product, partial [Amoebophrya sp. A120]